MSNPYSQNLWLAAGALLGSSATLVCCVLPAALVSVGAGAAVVGLVSAVPQLVWMSEHKEAVFGIAAALIAVSGFALWRARTLPCPADARLARSCERLRRASQILFAISVVLLAAGATFAFAFA